MQYLLFCVHNGKRYYSGRKAPSLGFGSVLVVLFSFRIAIVQRMRYTRLIWAHATIGFSVAHWLGNQAYNQQTKVRFPGAHVSISSSSFFFPDINIFFHLSIYFKIYRYIINRNQHLLFTLLNDCRPLCFTRTRPTSCKLVHISLLY